MHYCFNCGKKLLMPNQRFCSNCGQDLRKFQPTKKEINSIKKAEYALEDHKFLQEDGEVRLLFDELTKMIKDINPQVKQYIKKEYIAFGEDENPYFIYIFPYKTQLNLRLYLDYDKVRFSCSIFKKAKKTDRGNGDTKLKINNGTDLNKVFELIMMAYNNTKY